MVAIHQRSALHLNGFFVLAGFLGLFALSLWPAFRFFSGLVEHGSLNWASLAAAIGLWLLLLLTLSGFLIVKPNEAVALVFFGHYTGSVWESGFY